MVPEGLLRLGIGPEALPLRIIIMIDLLPLPVLVAFDAEMVVRLDGKGGKSRSGLQKALCEGDGGRNTCAAHLSLGYGCILMDVLLLWSLLGIGHGREQAQSQKQ